MFNLDYFFRRILFIQVLEVPYRGVTGVLQGFTEASRLIIEIFSPLSSSMF